MLVEAAATVENSLAQSFTVKVSPNPSTTHFKMIVYSKSNEPITIRIMDISGRTVNVYNKVQRNESATIGNNLRGGSYLAEVIQGSSRTAVKLIKIN